MKARRRGVIVNIIGAGGERLDFGYIAGAAGNAGLMAFTRAIGGTSPEFGVRVVGVNPGRELPLPSGRRADLVALGSGGEILIVEIKSSVADFRADQKWMDYRLHCDRLFFATSLDLC